MYYLNWNSFVRRRSVLDKWICWCTNGSSFGW